MFSGIKDAYSLLAKVAESPRSSFRSSGHEATADNNCHAMSKNWRKLIGICSVNFATFMPAFDREHYFEGTGIELSAQILTSASPLVNTAG